ncbi:hypothetical protein PR048_020545 [Dryococelus australis]|uniref:Pre-C2HC domain-containing protein n=1 Tax=Dryococelus australis TaxID=614101 RepID=A0ABQ9H6K7_9NEOP|nr:hypothetical protein PR048_020545 [Dryococelus australis]
MDKDVANKKRKARSKSERDQISAPSPYTTHQSAPDTGIPQGISYLTVTIADCHSHPGGFKSRFLCSHTAQRAPLESSPKATRQPIAIAPKLSLKDRQPLHMWIVELPASEQSERIFQLRGLCGLVIRVEEYQRPEGSTQCSNCRRFGHSARVTTSCQGGKGHTTTQCDLADRDDMSLRKCTSCGGNHAVNYKAYKAEKWRFPAPEERRKSSSRVNTLLLLHPSLALDMLHLWLPGHPPPPRLLMAGPWFRGNNIASQLRLLYLIMYKITNCRSQMATAHLHTMANHLRWNSRLSRIPTAHHAASHAIPLNLNPRRGKNSNTREKNFQALRLAAVDPGPFPCLLCF